MEEFSEVFQDERFRTMAGPAMHSDLVDGAIPCRHFKARTIPFKWRESVHQQLKKMKETLLRRSPLASQLHGATQWLSYQRRIQTNHGSQSTLLVLTNS